MSPIVAQRILRGVALSTRASTQVGAASTRTWVKSLRSTSTRQITTGPSTTERLTKPTTIDMVGGCLEVIEYHGGW